MSRANLDQAAARTLGARYQLVARIGSGASAEVYQATDLRLGRSVAVKQLRSDLTEDARFAKLFRTEAHLAARLSHPNIVTVFDWSADDDGSDGGAYIVTELLSGGSLRSVLDIEGTITPSQAAVIGLQAAKGLAFAHAEGLVHRDIKPANLLFGADGRIHVADFGIARAVAQAAWTEPEGVLIGTARYAAPEQATSGAVDGMADVYSLTVCLFEALTGEVPLVRDNALGTMVLRQNENLPIDESFGALAEPLAWAGLANPTERATATELAEAISAACRKLPEPEPLTLIDLTEHIGGPVAVRPNVRIDDAGDLIIEGIDDSDLAIPPDEEPRQVGSETVFRPDGSDGEPRSDGSHMEPRPNGSDEEPRPDGSAEEPGQDGRYDPTEGGLGRPGRSRGPVRWLVGLVLLVALGAGALLAGRLVAESRQAEVESIALGLPSYPVDDYASMTVAEIEAAAEANGWSVVVSEEFADGTEPDEILSQKPEPGTAMGRGGQVELVVSLGPQPRVVPETVGLPETEVRRAIEAANLTVGTVSEEHDETAEPGIVLEATIGGAPAQAGTEQPTGTEVDLVISSGPAPRAVPPLVGLTAEQARIALVEQQLELATTQAYSETVAEGEVISIDPAVGSLVPRGGTVTATVSLGLPLVVIPDVDGLPIGEAIDILKAAGFEVEIDGSIGATALGTRPGAGESRRLGSSVEIVSSER